MMEPDRSCQIMDGSRSVRGSMPQAVTVVWLDGVLGLEPKFIL